MQNQQQPIRKQSNEDVDLGEMVYKYLPYWPLFAALSFIGLIAAFIYLRYTTPVYQVSAGIMVKDEKKGVIDQSDIVESLDLFGSTKLVENEIEVLQSRILMKAVVTNLHLYAQVFEEGRIKNVSAYVTSPVVVEARHPEVFTKREKERLFFAVHGNSIKMGNRSVVLNEWFVDEGDTLRFVANTKYKKPETERALFFTLTDTKTTARSIIAGLSIEPSTAKSTVIDLTYKDVSPERGEDVLNELIRVYNQASIEDKNSLAANTLKFVENRLNFVVSELDSVETAVERFKTSKGIVDISEQGKLFLGSVETNDQKVSQINIQLSVLDQVEKYVISKDKTSGIVPSTLGVDDPVLSQLLQRLYELELEKDRLQSTTAENNPVLVGVQDQITKVKPGILENIRNQRKNLLAGKQNLNNNTDRYNGMLRTIPKKERELVEISRQQAIKNNVYTFLLQKREETALSFASAVADSRVVDFAEATPLPVSPKRSLVYLIGMLGGFAIAAAYIYAREMMNRTVLFRNEIEKFLSWPIVGEIAFDDSSKTIVVEDGKRNIIAEQFRQVRSSLAYLGINETHRKILITSTISGEGKSFVAANMAVSLALTGKKVVLMELDLRKPKLSPVFNIQKGSGISNYLIGRASVGEIIRPTSVNPNLSFISSGPIPPNPSELILNDRLPELIAELELRFDYIIIDTAPIAPVTDAHILSKYCDATLFIIRHGYTPKLQLKKLEEQNAVTSLKNVGIIFNGLKNRGFGKYGYGYGYSYGYGYAEATEA